MKNNLWRITPLRNNIVQYFLNDYCEDSDTYPTKVEGYINLVKGTPIIVEENDIGDVILANGKFVIPWSEFDTLAKYDAITIEDAPEATYATDLLAKLIQVKVNEPIVEVPVHEYINGKYIPSGNVYLESNMVYDCPMHGDEAVEFCYGLNEAYITAETIRQLIKDGKISISE